MISKEIFVQDRKAIAVTSMAKLNDKIYLGLTAGSHCMAELDPESNKITMCCETFPWMKNRKYCSKIHNALSVLNDTELLIGEGNHFTWDGLPVYSSYFERELPPDMLERKKKQGYSDIQYGEFCIDNLSQWNRKLDDPGGKVIKYNSATDSVEVIAALPQYSYTQSMAVDAGRGFAYVTTIPDNHFVFIDINTKACDDYGHISDYGHHNIAVAPNGCLYGAWLDYYNRSLKLLKFDPAKRRLFHLDTVILRDVGSKIAGNQGIDQWIVTKDGEMYFGVVSNSLLYRLYWENDTCELIGQAAISGRVSTMNEDDNGIIWIGAGYPVMRLIRFDRQASGNERFIDCGEVSNNYKRCYFHASCLCNDKLYLGETDGFSPSVHILDLRNI